VGGLDATAAALTGAIEYTPTTASSFYSIALNDLQLGGQSLGFGAADFGTTVVDTGTTSLALPAAILDPLTTAIANNKTFASSFIGVNGNWLTGNNCYASSLSTAQLDAMLPGLTFVVPAEGGGTFTIALSATESYLAPAVAQGTTYYCSGLLLNTAKTTGTILGVAAMSAHLVVFDGANSRVGFASQSHCR
jgi:hypothetical protein